MQNKAHDLLKCKKKQAETVMAAYRSWFDDIRQERVLGDWALLVGTRNDKEVQG